MKKSIFEEYINKSNEYLAVYDYLQKSDSPSKMEIMNNLGLKKTTLVRILDNLEEADLILPTGQKNKGIGRPSITYELNKHFGYLVGVHITRMRVMVSLLNLKFEEVASKQSLMTSFHSTSFISSFIQNSIDEILIQHKLTKEDIFSIGIAAVGSLNKREGIIYSSQSFFESGNINFRIIDELKLYFNGPIILDKGVNAAVLAEHYFSNKLSNNILYVVSGGWGLDCGVIKDNQLITSNLEDGKGIEHMVINFDGKACRCGKNGCLITYTSFEYILDCIKEEIPFYQNINTKMVTNATVTEAVNFLKTLNDDATKIIKNTARPLAIALVNLANIFKAQRVIISGPLFENYPDYYNLVNEYFELAKGDINTQLGNSELGEYAAVKGAAIMSYEALIQQEKKSNLSNY